MKTQAILFIIIIILFIAGIGYYLISPAFKTLEADEESPLSGEGTVLTMTDDQAIEKSDSMSSQAVLISQGDFMQSAHEVQGQALLLQQKNDKILRLENFETINGPNLHIYLSSDLSGNNFIDLGEIRATKGNVNYEIPPGVDTEKYNKVLVWCVPFKVLFSYAELS